MSKGWQRTLGIIVLILEVAIVPCAITFMLSQHLTDQSHVRTIAMSMLLGSIGLCIIISYLLVTERTHYPNRALLYELMLFMCSLALVIDLVSKALDTARLPALSMATSTLYYLIGVNVTFSFLLYEFSVLDILDKPRYSQIVTICFIFTIIDNIVTLLNIPFGFFFQIESSGLSHRVPTFWLSYIVPVSMIILMIYIGFRENRGQFSKRVFILFWVFPTITTMIEAFFVQLSIQYTGYTIAFIIMYMNVHCELDTRYINSLSD